MSYNRQTIASDLRCIGVEAGDTVFVHSSYRSIGIVDDGAGAVIGAFEDVLGDDGLLMMPSFNLAAKGNEARAAVWDVEKCPATTGWLTEFFRKMPGTYRSNHYSHAVAARGKGAEEVVAGHLENEGLISPWDYPPWGRTYGTHSPMYKAYRCGRGKVLMLGVDYKSSTYCHVVEVMFWGWRRKFDPDAGYEYIRRGAAGEFWDSVGRLTQGKVGDAWCRLFSISDFVETLLAEVKRDPDRFLFSQIELPRQG
ncbi:MAG: AAC(3) family N-acetyltransferase [Lentisphaerae bacterium]|nr:AAC(3) family N-acetyltransferase [Lentisphaerota bacterium]